MSRAIPERLARKLLAPSALIPVAREGLGNPAWAEARSRVLIARLSPFRDMDKSSSHLVLFAQARKSLPEAYIDLAFFPEKRDRDLLDSGGEEGTKDLPYYYGLASQQSPADFDLILVSNAFGLELVNLPYLFSTSRLAFRSSERSVSEEGPLVILGGSNAGATAVLVDENGDSPVDGIFFGEGEEAIGELAAILADRGISKDLRLARAEGVEGFWRTRGHGKIRGRRLRASPSPLMEPLLLNSPEASTARLQISAGCPGLCSFCFEGWDRRPYRELTLEEILEASKRLKRHSGAESLELFSFNFNTHSDIFALIFELGRIFRRVNLMSQRLDILADTPLLLEAELAGDKRSFTLGIEGVSASMRAFYRKGLGEGELSTLVHRLIRPGIKELKLFYIISGLESASDLNEFDGFMENLASLKKEGAPGLRVLVSAGYLVRLPGTPLQHASLVLDEAAFRGIVSSMEASCEASGVEFRLASHFDEYCVDQLLSLGDGRLLPWLEKGSKTGIVYDGSLTRACWASLRSFCQERGLLDPIFLGEKGEDYAFPFPFLERDQALLRREYLLAKERRDRLPCLGRACAGCGACPDAESARRIGEHVIAPPAADLVTRIGRLTAAKAAFKPVYIAVDLPQELSGATAEFIGAWLCRRLIAQAPEAEYAVFECREALFLEEEDFGIPVGFTGSTVFSVFGPKAERLTELAVKAGLKGLDGPPRPVKIRVEVSIWPSDSGAESTPTKDEEVSRCLSQWLREIHVAATEVALPRGRRFEIAERDRRKAAVLSAELSFSSEETLATLELGPKARLHRWLSLLGSSSRSSRIRIVDLE